MRLKEFNICHKILLMMIPFLLAACSDDQLPALETGTYLLDDITIQFPPLFSKAEGYDAKKLQQQREAHEQLQTQVSNSYIELGPNRINYYHQGEMLTGIITPENMGLTNLATFHLSPNDDHTIKVITPDYGQCHRWQCEVSFTLTPTSVDDPKLLALQQRLSDSDLPKQDLISVNEAELLTLIDTPYWGISHKISDHLNLKLSAIQSNGLIYGIPGHTQMGAFTLGEIEINPQDPQVEILSFYSNDSPSSDVHQISTITYLFILPISKDHKGNVIPHLDIQTLDSDNERYLSQDNGFIAKDTTGFYAVNFLTYPQSQRAVLALTEGLELEKVTQHYRSLLSLTDKPTDDSQKRKESSPQSKMPSDTQEVDYHITLKDISLPLSMLESRYNVTLTDMFRINEVTHLYANKLNEILKSEDLYLKTGPDIQNGYHLFSQNIGDYHFNETYIKIHNSPRDNVINALQDSSKKHQAPSQDLWHDPIYIYSTDPQTASGLSYFKEIQKGVTLEILTPATQGHIAEKVLFGKLLSGFNFTKLPKISSVAIPNIAQYEALEIDSEKETPSAPKKGSYHFKEGATDLQGRLL